MAGSLNKGVLKEQPFIGRTRTAALTAERMADSLNAVGMLRGHRAAAGITRCRPQSFPGELW